MKGRKPDITVTAKPWGGGKEDRIKVLVGWETEYGINCKLDRDVKEIVLKDGTVITSEGWYIDAKDWRQGGNDTAPASAPAPGAKHPDDDIPFMPVDGRLT